MEQTSTPDGIQSEVNGTHLWLILWKAARSIERHATRSVAGSGMCRSDFGVLEALLHKGPLQVNVLGAKVLLTSGSITAAVDRLERKGLAERNNDATDRRARIVHLTVAGRRLIRRLFAEHEQAMEEATSALTAEERAVLAGLLRKLGRGAEETFKNSNTREQLARKK